MPFVSPDTKTLLNLVANSTLIKHIIISPLDGRIEIFYYLGVTTAEGFEKTSDSSIKLEGADFMAMAQYNPSSDTDLYAAIKNAAYPKIAEKEGMTGAIV